MSEEQQDTKLCKSFSWMWAAWIAAFFAIEGVALFNKKSGDTLSEHVWFIRESPAKSLVIAIIVCLLGWLAYHFIIEGK